MVDGEEVYENTAVKERTFFVADDLYFLPQSSMNDMAKFYKGIFSGFFGRTVCKALHDFPARSEKEDQYLLKRDEAAAALLLGLSCQPDLLLLDEAFDGLDPVMRGAVKKLLSDDIAARDMTVIITSHNLRELEDLCDHVGLLHKGQILFEREIDELKLGFCKVHAAFPQGVDDQIFKKLDIMQMSRSGSLVNLVVRGTSADAAAYLLEQGAVFAEGVPLTLEEVFIHEMEAVGYDYNNIIF